MKKDTKTLIFLVGSIALLEFGTILLTPSYWVLGWIIGGLGISIFGFGAYWSMESIIKGIKHIAKK